MNDASRVDTSEMAIALMGAAVLAMKTRMEEIEKRMAASRPTNGNSRPHEFEWNDMEKHLFNAVEVIVAVLALAHGE